MVRSLAEVVGNAAVPFPKGRVDDRHRLVNARRGSQLDVVARTFGYLDDKHVFTGLIRLSDANLLGEWPPQIPWQQNPVVVGQPQPTHRAFYTGQNRRKFYHHHPGATRLTPLPPGIAPQAPNVKNVTPAPPGTRFRFTVDFKNLRDDELDLLLYCLTLEEQATVTFGPAALGRDDNQDGETLVGPLRHKLGGAKPHGAGSVHITITKQRIWTAPVARYRGSAAEVNVREGEDLENELCGRTRPFRARTDTTMRELRAMLIYVVGDPRSPIRYPAWKWFKENSKRTLKPTI